MLYVLLLLTAAVWLAVLAITVQRSGRPTTPGAVRALWTLVLLYPAGYGLVYYSWYYESSRPGVSAGLATLQPYFANFAHLLALGLSAVILMSTLRGRAGWGLAIALAILLGTPPAASVLYLGTTDSLLGIIAAVACLTALTVSSRTMSETLTSIRGPLRIVTIATLILIVVDPAVAFVPQESVDRSFFGISSRVTGPFSGPNYLALYLFISIFTEVASPQRRSRLYVIAGAALLLWTQARTPIGLAVIGGLILVAIRKRPQAGPSVRAGALAVVAALSMYLAPLYLVWTNSAAFNVFTTGRLSAWQLALQLFVESPIVGQGPGVYAEAADDRRVSLLGLRNAHSQIMESLASSGLTGAIAVGLVVVIIAFYAGAYMGPAGGLLIAPALAFAGRLTFGTPLLLGGLTVNLSLLAILVALVVAQREDCLRAKVAHAPSGERRAGSGRAVETR
ncbi:O-antigen ligase family protein [Georgenia sp. Marseille-Q6866]